jgi:hypothetical protein
MHFIVGLPPTTYKVDSIWVIVNRFTKSSHFIPMHIHFTAKKYIEIYIAHILCMHGVQKTIISNQGSQFVAHF